MKIGKTKLLIVFSLMLAFGFFLSKADAGPNDYCGTGYTLQGDACVPDSSAPNLDTGGFSNNPDDYTNTAQSSASSITIPQTDLPDPAGGIKAILTSALNWLLGILGILGIIGFVVSGIMYLISTGDENMVKRAKNGMLYSIVGIVVGLAGVVLISTINTLLGDGNMTNNNTEYNNDNTDNTN